MTTPAEQTGNWYNPAEMCSQPVSTNGFFGPFDTCGLGLPNFLKPGSNQCFFFSQQRLLDRDVKRLNPIDLSSEAARLSNRIQLYVALSLGAAGGIFTGTLIGTRMLQIVRNWFLPAAEAG